MDQATEADQNKQRFLDLLQRVSPDLYRVYLCIETINKFGGNGSIDIHMVNGTIKKDNGIYLQPGFKDNIVVREVFVKLTNRVEKYDGCAQSLI